MKAAAVPKHTPASLVPVGHISKAHGIRGEVVLVFEAESPDLLTDTVYLRSSPEAEPRPYAVERVRVHHGTLLASLRGVTSRNEAELLRRHAVLVPRDKLPPLAEDEVYLSELPGLRVMAEENGQEREIGVITSVDTPAGQDLWTITTAQGEEILFPAVEEFVLDIDLDAGVARIAPPPGLLDLYLADPAAAGKKTD